MTPFSKLLRSGLALWRKIASPKVQDWIESGVLLPFCGSTPSSFHIQNKYLPPPSRDFIKQEIKDLLRAGVIETTQLKPHCISPIHCVPKRNGKFRLIHDLRLLNAWCKPATFTNESINEVIQLVRPNDVLLTFDIKSGFYHVPVNKAHRKFLGFEWQGRYYVWKSVPFGLNSSPYFFYKVICLMNNIYAKKVSALWHLWMTFF